MRHSATRSLLERDDVLIVASVSCIYGLGSVEAYSKMTLTLQKNYDYNREEIIKSLVALQYNPRWLLQARYTPRRGSTSS